MYQLHKCLHFLWVLLFVITSGALYGAEVITIVAPANASTVTGLPLAISGTSSLPSSTVRIMVNSTITAYTTTDGSGNWAAISADINNGNYTVTADLLDISSVVLATDTNTFTVTNPATITITEPLDDDYITYNPVTIAGVASLPSTTVDVSIDAVLAATTTTDASGNWSVAPYLTTNGAHTLLAQLIVAAVPVASDSIGINAVIPIIFPTGTSQMRVIDGNIPTSGSGSGVGYTYVVSGSSATITFVPAFTSTPAVVATGQRPSGGSTVTLASASASAITLAFSTGTQRINFTVSALSA